MSADTVVITGVTNFLGYHLARSFAAAGHRVIGTCHMPAAQLDPLRRLRWERVQASLAACRLLDMTDAAAVRALIAAARPRLWVQQAGLGKDFAAEHYDLALANRLNLLPLDAIFAGMAEVGGAVLAAGSGMEYGAAHCPHLEDAACWPESPYGLAKLAATLRARQLARRHRVPTRIARIYTLFGELDGPDRLVTRLLARLQSGQRMGIAPGVARDICDVADLADGYLRLAADCARGPIFDIFNLSRGDAVPLLELARLMARQLHCDPALIHEDAAMLRPGEAPVISGDSRKARLRLGWAPRPLDESLMRLVRQASPAKEQLPA